MLASIDSPPKNNNKSASVSSDEKGANYLASLGWKVETPAMNKETVLIPKVFTDVFNNFFHFFKSHFFPEINTFFYFLMFFA